MGSLKDSIRPALATSWLLADIGGTNARFALQFGQETGVEHVRTLPVAKFPSLTQAVEAYLAEIAGQLGDAYRAPIQASFAVATAITGDAIRFTNSHWSFSRSQTQQELGLDTLLILNDFEALALSLPRLSSNQIKSIYGKPKSEGLLSVIGPGTGLGVASVVKTAAGWVALPCEGGHATISAADDFESDLLTVVRRYYPHVSAERLLSGVGLPVLHSGVSEVLGAGAVTLTPEQIVGAALNDNDPVANKTVDTFCAMLGSFAGNLALITGARSGVYIGGGIVPRLGDRFFQSNFRQRFEAKGRFQAYLSEIPTVLITDTLAALTGTALSIEQHNTLAYSA